jgi:membrane protease subunit (stomatin/prohibitin family)
MSFIDVVRWKEPAADVYAWKFPEDNLSTLTQLVVAESQEAVLFSRGRIIGKFGPGKHTLSTENLPLLRSLYGIPFGGNNPFTAQVWFVNKLQALTIPWSTDSFRYNDPDYKTMVPLKAQGRYGLKIIDAEVFLKKLVGTAPCFTAAALTDNFLGAIITKTKSNISRTMQSKQIGIKSISAYLDVVASELKSEMLAFWVEYGFELIGFFVTSIDIDGETPDGRQILQAMAQQSAQSIAGYTWQQGQSFKVAEQALSGQSDMGIFGAMMLASGNLFGGGGAGQSALLQPIPGSAGNQATASGQTTAAGERQIFCSKCAKQYSASAKFCPHCGNQARLCPKCGSDNAEGVAQCVVCGIALKAGAALVKCSHCAAEIPSDAAFCSHCGASMIKSCKRCKTKLPDDAPYCPTCGLKVE